MPTPATSCKSRNTIALHPTGNGGEVSDGRTDIPWLLSVQGLLMVPGTQALICILVQDYQALHR